MVDFNDFAPASPTPPASAPIAPVAPIAASIAPRAVIVSDRVRAREHTLAWPVSYDGRLYSKVIVTRPNAAQVADYFTRWLAAGDDETVRFPIFYDEDGERVPDAVMDALDADDDEAIMADVHGFLPARLLRLMAV